MNQYLVITEGIAMVSRPLFVVIICFGFIILLQSLVPRVMAQRKPSNVDEFLLQDQRTRKRKNYVLRLAEDDKLIRNSDNTNLDTEPYQTDRKPNELSAFVMDYANMIRNDVILLDDSVETRTRKRGNIKVKKYNQALPDPPCNCESINNTEHFGENSFPQNVVTINCKKEQTYCRPPYICKENIYEVKIIRRRERSQRREIALQDSLELPLELKYRWVAEKRPISVGCTCARDYILEN